MPLSFIVAPMETPPPPPTRVHVCPGAPVKMPPPPMYTHQRVYAPTLMPRRLVFEDDTFEDEDHDVPCVPYTPFAPRPTRPTPISSLMKIR